MRKLEYQVSFATPAFLGNADQLAQWRTPPFKALIRHWWRIVKAPQVGYDHERLRRLEGSLFGNAWIDGDFRKSEVRIRLSNWETGKFQSSSWPGGRMEEVITTRDGKGRVRSDVYLGYGPVLPPSKKEGRTRIEIRGAIDSGDNACLRLTVPSPHADEMLTVLKLVSLFGALGSRARNGWGSLVMAAPDGGDSAFPESIKVINPLCQPLARCLERDWPHAFGSDAKGPLIWHTTPCDDWRQVMGRLANVRVAVRRVAKDFSGPGSVGGIHLLGYPAGGKWALSAWRGAKDEPEGRLASQLRFKVSVDENKRCRGTVVHLPCRLPENLARRLDRTERDWIRSNEIQIWETIHECLDSGLKLKRGLPS